MSTAPKISIRASGPGWERLRSRLEAYANIGATFEGDGRDIAHDHLQYARELCSVRTGTMRDSIYLAIESRHQHGEKAELVEEATERSVDPQAFRVASQVMTFGHSYIRYFLGCKDTPKARYVEYGTRKMPAHPFMRPAYEIAKLMWRSWCRQLPARAIVQTSTETLFGFGSRTNMHSDQAAR